MVKRSAPWIHLEQFPPIMVRCMGRTGRGCGARGLTIQEVAEVSGLTVERCEEIESLTSWKGVDVLEAEAFCRGCKFDPTDAIDRRDKAHSYFYLCEKRNREPFWYLRNTKHWPHYQKLIQLLRSSMSSSPK